ncbi:hypothetical protein Q7P35_006376 [Cladosporium inversicolor]
MHFTKPSQPPAPPPSEKPQGLFEEHHDAIPLASLRLAKSEPTTSSVPPLGNSSLTITHTRTNKTLGSIRFPKLSKSTIPLGINGRGTLLEHAPDKPHWELKSTSIFDRKRKPTTLLWKRDERLWRTVVLVDVAETRNVLARIDGDLLVFEDEDLSFESMNEIVVSAVVLAEHARRRMGDEEVGDLGRSIGDIAGECCERPKVIRAVLLVVMERVQGDSLSLGLLLVGMVAEMAAEEEGEEVAMVEEGEEAASKASLYSERF